MWDQGYEETCNVRLSLKRDTLPVGPVLLLLFWWG